MNKVEEAILYAQGLLSRSSHYTSAYLVAAAVKAMSTKTRCLVSSFLLT
jgi:hypothetical protein